MQDNSMITESFIPTSFLFISTGWFVSTLELFVALLINWLQEF